MKSLSLIQGSSIVVGVLSLVVFAVLFGLRYGWHLNSTDYIAVQATMITSGLAILAVWLVYPSPGLAVGICAASFLLPPLFKPDKYPGIDLRFLPYIIFCCALFGLAVELRRRALLR